MPNPNVEPAGNVDPANDPNLDPNADPNADSSAGEPAVPPDPAGEQDPEDKHVPLRALQEERERRQQLQAEIEILKQIAGDNVLFDASGHPVPRQQQQQQQQPSNNVTAEMDKLWEDDPRKAVQMEIMSAMTWRDTMDAEVDKQEISAAQKYSDYNEYRDTVRQYVRALPLDQRAKPGVIDLAYYVVKGQASNNIYQKAQQDLLKRIQAGENVQGLTRGTTAPTARPKGVQPSAEQLAAADMMGMKIEDYMSHMPKGASK